MPVPLYEAKAELFRTLGHPGRIRILELLSEREHAVFELLGHVELRANNLSQQLSVLRRSGLVASRRVDGQVRYSLAVEDVAALLAAGRGVLHELSAARVIPEIDAGGTVPANVRSPREPAPEPAGA